VERLLKEIAGLTARKLTGATVALSICKRLTQPIQERVQPAYEYWGREDPTRGQKRKVSRVEAANRFARIMAGQIRDKGCPKALCLKRPTNAVSFLESSKLFSSFPSCFLHFRVVFSIFALFFRLHPLGCDTTRIFCRLRSWCTGPPVPLPEGDPSKETAMPAELRQPADEDKEFSSDSSVGSELEVEITGTSGPQTSATPKRKTCRAMKKIPLSKAGLTVAQKSLRSSTPKGTSKVRGASAPPATARIRSASAGLQAEKEAARGLGQLRGEARQKSHPPRAAPVTPRG